jgi:hypothetical protein
MAISPQLPRQRLRSILTWTQTTSSFVPNLAQRLSFRLCPQRQLRISPILSISVHICRLHASSVREKAKWLSYSTTTMVRAGSALNERETEAEFA